MWSPSSEHSRCIVLVASNTNSGLTTASVYIRTTQTSILPSWNSVVSNYPLTHIGVMLGSHNIYESWLRTWLPFEYMLARVAVTVPPGSILKLEIKFFSCRNNVPLQCLITHFHKCPPVLFVLKQSLLCHFNTQFHALTSSYSKCTLSFSAIWSSTSWEVVWIPWEQYPSDFLHKLNMTLVTLVFILSYFDDCLAEN